MNTPTARRVRCVIRAMLAICLALAGQVTPAAAPSRVIAEYDVHRNGTLVGTMREIFESRDGTYRIRSESQAIGFAALFARARIVVTSEGRMTESGLRPARMEYIRGNDAPVAAEFDWPAQQLVMRRGTQHETVPLERNTQDRLSTMYQFMFLPLVRTAELHLVVTNGTKVERYRYDVRRGEPLETRAARFATMHLTKQRSGAESATEIWLSEANRQIPVRLLIVEPDGDRFDQVLTRLEVFY